MILYSIIIFGYDVSTDNISCIDHEIMDFDSETPFWSSVCDTVFWTLCFDLGVEESDISTIRDSTMSTKSPAKYFLVGIVLSFVFSGIPRCAMIRETDDSL
jgi:hypothetical protein